MKFYVFHHYLYQTPKYIYIFLMVLFTDLNYQRLRSLQCTSIILLLIPSVFKIELKFIFTKM